MAMITSERIKLARKFRDEYYALVTKDCTLEEWIMFRFSCTKNVAMRLLIAVNQDVTTQQLMSRAAHRRRR